MYKTQKVQKCYLKCSIYKIDGATAVFVFSGLQIIQTFGPPNIRILVLNVPYSTAVVWPSALSQCEMGEVGRVD